MSTVAIKQFTSAQLISLLKEASEVFKGASKKAKILSAISWHPRVAREFFKKKEQVLPTPTYSIDREGLKKALEPLHQLAPKLKGEHPVLQWLSTTQESIVSGIRLLLDVETESFYQISTQLYGNSKTRPFEGPLSNQDLASAILSRMAVANVEDVTERIDLKSAEEFAADIETRLKGRTPIIPVRVEITEDIAARIVAGMNRVRIRKDARFSELDLNALWNHEIESHCLTAHNGSLQGSCDFLMAGGPRTTLTQEGLAVFYEIFGHTMSQGRFISLCDRVEAIKKVEQGADFIELYRWQRERSENAMEAFYSVQRVFRGAKITGGAPFTKDIVYLAGLLGVFNFLRVAVKGQNRLLVESLVCGRISLDDVGIIAWLRAHGILTPPRFVPDWLKQWEALLSFFSFSAILSNVDLQPFQNYFERRLSLQEWDLQL